MTQKSRDKYVVREFDRAARSYDESRIVKSYQRRTQMLVISKMHIRKGMNVLDLGCGTGSGAIDIALQLEGTGRVIGIDLSAKMIEKAKQKLAGFQYDNVEFTVGSGGSIDYVDYFDYVLSTNAFHHFEKKEEIFSEVWKSLKHDGTFIVQDICDDYLLMKLVDLAGKVGERAHAGSATSRSLRNLFVSAGFTDVAVDRVRFNWFWRIMIGSGIKRSSGQPAG
jgi:ubiquinone/menaquinone biosynthesis C-methylase UbiE